MKEAPGVLLLLFMSLLTLSCCVKTRDATVHQSALQISDAAPPYPIAGPYPGRELREKPAEPQTGAGLELNIPGLTGVAGVQFASVPFASFLVLAYSCVGPAFVWLAGTARTPLMKEWYSSFNLGFFAFSALLEASIELPLVASALFAIGGAALGYVGFRYPDKCFIVITLWSSFVVVNLLHVICGATERTNYFGLAGYSWLLYVAALVVFVVYAFFESFSLQYSQSFICAFTSSFGAVAGLSFVLKYFFNTPHSPFDSVSFLSLPIQYRWNDPISVALLVSLLVLTFLGFGLSLYREHQEGPSKGFGADGKGPLTAISAPLAGGYETFRSSISSESLRLPLLTFAGSLTGGGSTRRQLDIEDEEGGGELAVHRGKLEFDNICTTDTTAVAIDLTVSGCSDSYEDSLASDSYTIPCDPSPIASLPSSSKSIFEVASLVAEYDSQTAVASIA